MTGRPFPEAERRLRGGRWRGSDDAYSVHLGDERTLWLYGDTLVERTDTSERAQCHIIRNSAALQTGLDPSSATVEMLWRGGADAPSDFFPADEDGTFLWPAAGILLDDTVLLFFMEVEHIEVDTENVWGDELPFKILGWRALRATNVDEHPRSWQLTRVSGPPDSAGATVGTALLRDDPWLYAWCFRENKAFLCRWPLADARAGDLSRCTWWAGPSTWVEAASDAAVAVEPVQTEFTVHREDDGRLCLVDVAPFMQADCAVNVRTAAGPEGPWTPRRPVYAIPEAALDGVVAYAGKAHPQLEADGLVVTYATNASAMSRVLGADDLYYPRYVVVPRAAR